MRGPRIREGDNGIFEMRFSSDLPVSSILPGLLLSKLDSKLILTRLPAADIPNQFRIADPSLRYTPTLSAEWETYKILIGDNVLALGFNLPYPGWTAFKERIFRLLDAIADTSIIGKVERFSLKYVDLIPTGTAPKKHPPINLGLTIGGFTLSNEVFQLRIEIPIQDSIHVVQMVSSATVQHPSGKQSSGAVLDVDSIINIANKNLIEFRKIASERLDELHEQNKKLFFQSLTQDALNALWYAPSFLDTSIRYKETALVLYR